MHRLIALITTRGGDKKQQNCVCFHKVVVKTLRASDYADGDDFAFQHTRRVAVLVTKLVGSGRPGSNLQGGRNAGSARKAPHGDQLFGTIVRHQALADSRVDIRVARRFQVDRSPGDGAHSYSLSGPRGRDVIERGYFRGGRMVGWTDDQPIALVMFDRLRLSFVASK